VSEQDQVAALREKRLRAHARMTEIREVSAKEDRPMSAEERGEWEKAYADFDGLTKDIDVAERQAKIDGFMKEPAPHPAAAAVGVPTDEARDNEHRAKYAEAFNSYLRGRATSEQRELLMSGKIENRDQGTTTTAGGYLVPAGFLEKLTLVRKYFGGMRQVANVIETASGQPLVWPKNDDTGNVAVIIGENTQVSEADMTFGQNTLNAFNFTSGVIRVSRQLMTDSAFDVESIIADRAGQRFGRGENAKFTKGAGTTEPAGVVGAATAGAGTTVDYAGLVATMYSLDAAYRPGASWMMSDAAAKTIMLLTDSAGRPLWVPSGTVASIANGQQDLLLGRPVVINNDLDAPAGSGSKVPVLFGDFKAGYIIRDVAGSTGILRLDERYADYDQVGFIGFSRVDGAPDDAKALVKLVQPA
jgi:HK97 family phage major capsid protein